MRKFHATALVAVTSIFAGLSAYAQAAAAGPAWDDPANWKSVQPSVTESNIVYATVPLVHNPSAEASQTPGAVRKPMPTSGAPGTMDVHLDIYQIASTKPTPVSSSSTAAAGSSATVRARPAPSAPSSSPAPA